LIPAAYIQEWSHKAPWPDLRQVEQDLIITRALCDLFLSPTLSGKIAFRGGTAINKLLFQQPLRYSEDIDLVQTHPRRYRSDGWQASPEYANRDLFDLHEGIKQLSMHSDKLIACFEHYLAMEGKHISRAVAEQRMLKKLERSLTEDVAPLLPAGIQFNDDDALLAFGRVWTELVTHFKGDPWKLSGQVIDELRNKKLPNLLR